MKVLANDSVEIISELTTAPRIEIVHDLNEMAKYNRETTLHICNCTRLCMRDKPVAFAPAMAARFAATLSELFTTICNGRVGCPDYFPFFANLLPSPISWILCFWLVQNCLSPHTACLTCCTFSVLNQSCSGTDITLSGPNFTS